MHLCVSVFVSENPEKHCHQDHKCIKEAVKNTLQKVSDIFALSIGFTK